MLEDVELESSVIAILFRDPARIAEIASIVKPDCFTKPKLRNLYTSAFDTWKKGESVTVYSVLEYCKGKYGNHHDYDKFVNDIIGNAAKDEELEDRAKKLAEMLSLRKLDRALSASLSDIRAGRLSGSEASAIVESSIRKISAEEEVGSQVASTSECLSNAIHQIERVISGEVVGIPTHITAFNDLTGGMAPGEWTVIAGRPGTGKTIFAVDVLDELCTPPLGEEPKRNGVIFSIEMSKEQLINRLLAKRASVDFQKFRTGRMSSEEVARIAEAAAVINKSSMLINDEPTTNTADIFSQASKIKNKLEREGKNLDFIVIDNLSILKPPRPTGSRQADVAEMTRDIKIMTKKLNVHVFVIVHLNRQIENRGDGIPRLADLRESGSIEQDADVIIGLHKPDENGQLVNAHIIKNRNGPEGVVPMKGEFNYMRFKNFQGLLF